MMGKDEVAFIEDHTTRLIKNKAQLNLIIQLKEFFVNLGITIV